MMLSMKKVIFLIALTAGIPYTNAGIDYFWQLSDIHYDPTYFTTQETCNENVPQNELGQFGNFECDPPWKLVEDAIKAMKHFHGAPKFILWAGDNPGHPKDRSKFDADLRLEMTRNISETLASEFHGVPVVVSLGNHDYFPVDQLPGSSSPQYDGYYDIFKNWIPAGEESDHFKSAAYYKMEVHSSPKVYAMVVNTNLFYHKDQAVAGQADPGGQFTWMESTFSIARTQSAKIHLFVHVPPGVMEGTGLDGANVTKWMVPAHNTRFNSIIRTYSDVIIGIYSCHSHSDSFRIYYNSEEKPVASMFIAPSVTPWRARLGNKKAFRHNPALRRILYDNVNFKLVDVETYFLDLEKANQQGQATWTREYSFRSAYAVANATAEALHELVEKRFKSFGDNKFHQYHLYQSVSTKQPLDIPAGCSCVCKTQHICSIQNVDFDAYNTCMEESVSCKACLPQPVFYLFLSLTLVVSYLIRK